MSDMPEGGEGVMQEKLQSDAERIGAELVRLEGGTDPFASAVRATRMPMIVTNPRQPDNPVVFVNNSFLRLTGYAREEILGRNCRFLQGPETDPEAVARIRAAVEAAESIEIDIRNHRKNGEPFWNRLLLAPVPDEAGKLAYFFASQMDVTLERERLSGLESRNTALTAELARRLAEQERSEARLRFATTAARLGVWELDLRTEALTASALCKENFGRGPEAPFTYAELQDAVHPSDRERVQAAMECSIRTGAEYDIEYRVKLPGGAVRWVQIRAQVVRDIDGTPLRMAGVSLDVTERREAEMRLELSEQSLRLATEAAEVGTWDLDLGTDTLTWSDRTKAMFGISPGAACSMADFYAGLHPDDRATTAAAFASALDPAVRATYDVEYRTIGKEDGVVRWVAAKGRGLFVDGACYRALGTAIDITARKRAERRQVFLVELWDRLRQLTEPRAVMRAAAEALGTHLGASRVGFGLVEPGGGVTMLEPGYAAQGAGPVPLDAFGAELIGRQLQGMTVVCPDIATDPAYDPAAWAATDMRALVFVPLLRDGRLRASLFVNRSEPYSWPAEEVALVEDVAARTWDAVERARAEAALRDANARLEERIATALAEQEQIGDALRQAQKMEAVGQLTGGIAHDFNNLLTGIMGSLELMQRRAAAGRTDGLERYASTAITSAQRAAALTQRLLAFARRQPLDPKRIEANRLVAGMEDLLRRTLGPAIRLEMVLSGGLWPTLCDPNQLESAILNLAINARDAMPEGGQLTVETANAYLDDAYARAQGGEIRPGQYVAISVSDTGTGMTPDVIARAFEPFFTTKPTGQGTGLGLSMLYGFVKQSNGHVRIYSEIGQGTTFRLYMPRHRDAGTEDDQRSALEQPLRDLHAMTGEIVLVVEDEAAVRSLVVETLAELGYAVLEATNGSAALSILRSQPGIDLLVTDVGLPELNGRQVADAARVAQPGLKVLFMTGYAHNAAVGNGPELDAGMEIISKPFALDALARKVRAMIESA